MQFLRRLGLALYLDHARYLFFKAKNWPRNLAFRKKHPTLKLPPDYLMYESFRLDYAAYVEGGREVAAWLVGHFERHLGVLHGQSILDWGCGPGRVVRHLPGLLPSCSVYGTDYNQLSIQWCRQSLPGITFFENGILPPVPAGTGKFDIIYGISILTHLSESNHHLWLAELMRLLAPGGILFLTTHGSAFRNKLSPDERATFDQNRLVIRSKVKEGHRVYGAFHPAAFTRALFQQYGVIREFIPGKHQEGKYPEQDIWILGH